MRVGHDGDGDEEVGDELAQRQRHQLPPTRQLSCLGTGRRARQLLKVALMQLLRGREPCMPKMASQGVVQCRMVAW